MNYLLLPLLSVSLVACFFAGGLWLAAPWVLAVALAIPLDEMIGDNWSKRLYKRYPILLDAILYVQLPLLAAATILFAYYFSDWQFLGATVNAARAATEPWHLAVATATISFFYATAGINVAHELVHRTKVLPGTVGRWLLSFSLDTGFALEHVYGHHPNVGTPADPATPARGKGFWLHFLRMLYYGNRNAWRIEKRFLTAKGKPIWSLSNRFLTGLMMSLVWLVLFAATGNPWALLAFFAAALIAKLYLELTNYIEHYGLVRVPGTRVEARHAWNSSRRVSNWLLFNLPRHADHHEKPNKAYWDLEARADAPQLPWGHFVMCILATLPWVYHWQMRKPLKDWDERLATPGERELVAAQMR